VSRNPDETLRPDRGPSVVAALSGDETLRPLSGDETLRPPPIIVAQPKKKVIACSHTHHRRCCRRRPSLRAFLLHGWFVENDRGNIGPHAAIAGMPFVRATEPRLVRLVASHLVAI